MAGGSGSTSDAPPTTSSPASFDFGSNVEVDLLATYEKPPERVLALSTSFGVLPRAGLCLRIPSGIPDLVRRRVKCQGPSSIRPARARSGEDGTTQTRHGDRVFLLGSRREANAAAMDSL